MSNIATLDQIRTIMGAFDDGRTVRTAAALAGVSKDTANTYRKDWERGLTPDEARLAKIESYRAGRFSYGRKGNDPREPA